RDRLGGNHRLKRVLRVGEPGEGEFSFGIQRHDAYSVLPRELTHNAARGKMFRLRAQPRETMDVKREVQFRGGSPMDSIVYLVGLVVIVLAILSFFGLR